MTKSSVPQKALGWGMQENMFCSKYNSIKVMFFEPSLYVRSCVGCGKCWSQGESGCSSVQCVSAGGSYLLHNYLFPAEGELWLLFWRRFLSLRCRVRSWSLPRGHRRLSSFPGATVGVWEMAVPINRFLGTMLGGQTGFTGFKARWQLKMLVGVNT